jgi:hypothetical protein
MRYLIYIAILFSGLSANAQVDSTKVVENHVEPVYYLIYDNEEFLIFGQIKVGARLATGRNFLEQFATEEELEDRVDELKWEGYYEGNK